MTQQRRPTIVEVARAAGVSVTTVSVVLNDRPSAVRISEATRAAVQDAATRLGYIPNQAAQNLRRRPKVLTLLTGNLANPYFTDIAASVRSAAANEGYELNVVEAVQPESEARALAQLRNGSSAGAIVATGRHRARGQALDALQALVRGGLPAVIVCDSSPDPAIPAIRIDDAQGACEITSHLLKLGHRAIAHFSSQAHTLALDEASVDADRFRGYRQALLEAGVEFEPVWLVQGEPSMPGGYAMMRELLARPGERPTGVFCTCDVMAIGALRALHEHGLRAPDDMAVAGFDGILLGQYTIPSLTTIDQPREQIGRLAAEMLLRLVQGQPAEPAEQILPATLLVRESCGATRRTTIDQ
ncbi:MAG TPA: LacI family DNA-binding transcriptional regulator [Roseiflexaceae bacterium]|nr:LacI family DNA-binding transcriptional regulator [Roseiflexaceae bacterium]